MMNDRCIEVWMYGGIETTERQLKGLRCPSGIYFIDSGSSPEWQTKLQFIIYAEKPFKTLRFCYFILGIQRIYRFCCLQLVVCSCLANQDFLVLNYNKAFSNCSVVVCSRRVFKFLLFVVVVGCFRRLLRF